MKGNDEYSYIYIIEGQKIRKEITPLLINPKTYFKLELEKKSLG